LSPLGRLLCSIGVLAVLLVQSAIVLAAPTPSPGLDTILLKPPGAGYKEEPKTTPGILEGPFDAAKYAQATAATDAGPTTQALARAGFVTGYGRTWVSAGSAHVWVEAVMAFTGARGAATWLRQSEAADKADPSYAQALTISGIGTYYGARLVDKVHKAYGDAFVFVKGNDVYLVTYVSNKNDLASIAATQTKKQFDAAPPLTIPQAQWPESKVTSSPFDALKIVGAIIAGVLILGLIAAAAIILRSRRRPAQAIPAQGSHAASTPAAVVVPAAVAAPAPAGGLQMSDDRRSWWDGAAWRDAEREVPPAAQRSEDGHFWWDGAAWRPMPPSPFQS
jgi:hypothetical protein